MPLRLHVLEQRASCLLGGRLMYDVYPTHF